MARLTKRAVEGALLKAAEYVLWDTETPGLGVRIHPSGRRTVIFKYRVGRGRQARLRKASVGPYNARTFDAVRIDALGWLAAARRGEDPGPMIAGGEKTETIAELAERYLAEHARQFKKPKSIEDDERNVRNHVVPLLGRLAVADVTRADVDRALADVKAGRTAVDEKTGRKRGRRIVRGGPVVANRVRALLSTMFSLAESRWALRPPQSNPVIGSRKYAEQGRERYLSSAELARLGDALAHCEASGTIGAPAAAAIRLLALTGARKSEILGLRWQHVDLERAELRLPDSKTGAKTIHLAPPALEVLVALHATRSRNPHVLQGKADDAPLADLKGPGVGCVTPRPRWPMKQPTTSR